MQTVVYSGIPGSYAEEAALAFFPAGTKLLTAASFAGACEKLAAGEADRVVLPIENSTTGAISAVYDLLSRYGFSIVGEEYVRIEHCLLALPGAKVSDIQEVVSHEQGISQSEEFLAKYPGWIRRPVYNTAAAAQMVAQSGSCRLAAIASRRAAACYGLEILAPGINQKAENYTRFLIAAKEPPERCPGSCKVSILFTLPHRVGSLARALGCLERGGMNLVKIESRPLPDRNWEYLFFVDFLAEGSAPELDATLSAIQAGAGDFRFLGCYRQGNPRGGGSRKNLVLIGMPGSGKTTVGKRLAKLAGRQFIDLDDEIRQAAGKSIPAIFAEDGEPAFRRLETACAQEASRHPGQVIACGGGIILRKENMEALKQTGTILFLDRSVSDICSSNLQGRPLIAGDPSRVQALYDQRIALYREYADVTVDCSCPPETAAKRAWELVREQEDLQ